MSVKDEFVADRDCGSFIPVVAPSTAVVCPDGETLGEGFFS
jgi:hypothetical protein